jgi:hypothetical protein
MKAKCDNAKNIVSPSTLLDELMQNFALYNWIKQSKNNEGSKHHPSNQAKETKQKN